MRITYIGHATLLLEIGGLRLLTDPNFDPSLGGMLKRVAPPGIPLEALPALDAILVTHAHADHLSFTTLQALERHPIPTYAPPAVARWIRRKGIGTAVDLPPGEHATIGDITITAAPAQHRGTRYAVDRWRHETNMYLVATKEKSIFFAGDTALHENIDTVVHEKLSRVGRRLDVALLPIGYAPAWKRRSFRRGHLTSADALTLFERVGARHFIPYHWGTFNHVTSSAYDAILELRAHVRTHPRGADVRILEPGESYEELDV